MLFLKKYIIFGLQRSGTNYLEQLVSRNFFADNESRSGKIPESIFWKHDYYVPSRDLESVDYPILVIYKNPYAWFESNAYRNGHQRIDAPFHYLFCNSNRKELEYISEGHADKHLNTLSLPVSSRVNETLCILSTKNEMLNIIRIYKLWYENWIVNYPESLKSKTYFIKYEDLLNDEKRIYFLNKLKNDYDFEQSKGSYVNLEPGAVPRSLYYKQKHTDLYINEDQEILSHNTILKINKELGEDLFKKLNYKFKTFA